MKVRTHDGGQLIGPPRLPPDAPWVTFLPSVPVDRFTFPALEEDVIYDDVPCESPDAHQPGMGSWGSFPGLSLGWGGRAMLGVGEPLLLLSVPTFHTLQISQRLTNSP